MRAYVVGRNWPSRLNRPGEKPDKLVIVVHGVGDPAPGKTLSLFARSLAAETKPLHEAQEVLWLDEKSDNDYVKTFPAHRRRIKSGNQTLELCEAYWADLSRVGTGWFGVIYGIFQIIFGLRYVAYVAGEQPGPAAGWLKRLGLISSKILHGPVLAVTFYLAVLMIAVCGTQMMWQDSYKTDVWPQIVLLGCSVSTLAAAIIGTRLTSSRVVKQFWFWVSVTTMFITGLMLLKLFCLDQLYPELPQDRLKYPGLLWYCRILLVFLGLLWFTEIQVLIAMAGCWFVALTHPRAYRPALHIALLVPALAIGFWGQAIPMLWVIAKEGLSVIAELPEFSAVFDDALPFLGVQLVMLAIIGIAATSLLIRYVIWRKFATINRFNSGSRAPRLIIGRSLQIVLAACTVAGVMMVSSLCIIKLMGGSYTNYRFGLLMVEANKYAVSVLVPMGGLALVLIPRLRPALDMLLDVVNHFYFRPTSMTDALNDIDEFDISETTFENGALFFAKRDALYQRFKRILHHYRQEYNHHPELVVVSHSQGTMMAIEILNDEELSWINNTFSSVSLVTMGSPFTHLYQHYFGHWYPALDQPYWTSLKRRINNWTNICRIDDFVGTEVRFPDNHVCTVGHELSHQHAAPINYCNHPVGPRGHTNYWSDQEVLSELRNCLINNAENHRIRRSA